MLIRREFCPFCTFALLVAVVAGCGGNSGPETARVRGKVMLDGQPLPGATVMFIPENGRPAVGVTNDSGEYELMYTASRTGALPGKHRVQISTGQPAGEDREGNPTPSVPEKVPVEYNQKSTLEFDVKAGELNEANFDLKSGGTIIQPEEDV